MRKPLLLLLGLAATALVAQVSGLFSTLKSAALIGKQENGVFLLPTNQLLRPWGEQTLIKGRPVHLVFDSAKQQMAVLNWRSVVLLDGASGSLIAEVPSKSTSYTGLAFRPGDRELWASETTRNGPDNILVIELGADFRPTRIRRIDLTGHPVPAGIAFSGDGKTAYVAFSRNNTLAVIDAATRQIRREIPTGMAPFDVAVSKQRGTIFVSNRGGKRPASNEVTAPSSGSLIAADPITGSTSSGTVTAIDGETMTSREARVGLAPSMLALSPDERTLTVANSHSDSLTLLETGTLAATDVKIPAYPDAGVVGSQPLHAAFAPDGNSIYVACGGTNAITVLRRANGKWAVAGAVPTGWFPSAIAVDGSGALRVINVKGVGNTADGRGTFNSKQYEGSLIKIPPPAPAQLTAGTREVRAANAPKFEPSGGVANLASLGIEHVLFIIKENRTYDQVFGDMGKGASDPRLVFYGKDITPNHHALAERYVLLDNFYTGGAISFDGHHWLMQAFVSDYVERAFAASPRGYAWNMADALTVSPAGFFWQGAQRPLRVRIYGEFCLPARWDPVSRSAIDMDERDILPWREYWRMYKEGTWRTAVGSRSGVPALVHLVSQSYPFNSTAIPDQIRADEYVRELAERDKSGEMPHLSVLTLDEDHTNGTRPDSPSPRAMVADNDLALGRIVEALSKTRFWQHSLVLVVEDDAQDGVDHIDGHRTVALAIGPNIRRGALDSNHYNHTSMVRTIQEIFGIPPKTQFLESARAMHSVFTTDVDSAPYQALQPKVALDEMNPPLKALQGRKLWAARQSAAMNWRDIDDIPEKTLNRILWWDAKGYDKEYPR